MAKKNFSLGIAIGAIDKVSAPLSKMQKKFQSFGSKVEGLKSNLDFEKKKWGLPKLNKSFEDLGKSLKPIGVAIGGLGIAAVGAFALVKSSAANLTALDDLSKTTGLGIKSLQELRYAAQQMGSSSEEMDEGLKTFTSGMGKARAGSGKLLGFLEKINPAFKNQLLATKSNEEAFDLMMKSMEKVTDPQKKLALSMAVFGSAGESMARVSGEGAEKMKRMREEARKLGLATEEDVEAAGAFEDGMHKMMFGLDAAKNKIASGVMPVLTKLFEKLTAWLGNNQEKIQEFAQMLATNLPTAIEFCANAFNSIINSPLLKALLWIVDALGAGNIAFIALGAYVLSVIIPVVTALASVFTALGFTFAGTWAALLGPIGWIIAAIALVGLAAYGLYKYWDDICAVFERAWTWIKKIASFGLDKLMSAFGGGEFKTTTESINQNNSKQIVENRNLGARDLGAQRVASEHLQSPGMKNETEIKVKFDNAPKGTRTEVAKSSEAAVDLSMGYSLVGGL